MNTVSSLEDWPGDGAPSAVTIGMFDGVHRGHQELLRSLVASATPARLRTVAVTFDHHPRMAVAGAHHDPSLTTLPEKEALLAGLGIGLLAVIRVQGSVLRLDAVDFVTEYLVGRLQSHMVLVGYDFRFGRDRAGDVKMLRQLGEQCGFLVRQANPVVWEGEPIKSTRIRENIAAGQMEAAAELLGRPYTSAGVVVRGDGIGRQLGFPTANIRTPEEKMLPGNGVYAGRCDLDGAWRPAAINLGVRPTRDGTRRVLEAHLPGYSGDLYDREITLEFLKRIRDERRFPDLDSLKTQIRRDVAEVVEHTGATFDPNN